MSPLNNTLLTKSIVHPIDVKAPAQIVTFAPSAGKRSGPTTAAADRSTGKMAHHPFVAHSSPVAAHPPVTQQGGASDHIVKSWLEGSKDVTVRYPHPAANQTSYRTVHRASEGMPGGIAPLVTPPSRILPSQGRTDGMMPPVHSLLRRFQRLERSPSATPIHSMAA